MMNHLALLKLLVAQQGSQQGRFSGPVSSNEPDFDIVDQRQLGRIKQHLFTVSLVGITNLDQNGHGVITGWKNVGVVRTRDSGRRSPTTESNEMLRKTPAQLNQASIYSHPARSPAAGLKKYEYFVSSASSPSNVAPTRKSGILDRKKWVVVPTTEIADSLDCTK